MATSKTTTLAALLAAVKVFREECRTDIGSQTIDCFLQVAIRGETPMFDLIEAVGVSNAAISRNITLLGRGTHKEPGLGLVESYEDDMWRRRKLVKLTPAGTKLAEKIASTVVKVMGGNFK